MAFDEQQIRIEWLPIRAVNKTFEGEFQKFTKKKQAAEKEENEFFQEEPIPTYSEYYVLSVRHARALSVHADGLFPYELLRRRAPNEHPREFDYRRWNYQPITKPAWERAEKTVNRIWNRNNFKVFWHDGDKVAPEEKAQTYFEDIYPEFKSIYTYFENVITPFTFKDSNAVVVVKPRFIPVIQDADGDLKADQSELLEPIAFLYESHQVLSYAAGISVLALTSEKTKLSDDLKGEMSGRVYEFYDDMAIYKLFEEGTKAKRTIRIELYFQHNLGYLPAWRLPGKPQQLDFRTINISFFSAALPYLNNAVIDASTLFMSKHAHAFPQRWEIVDPCKADGCRNGLVWDSEKNRDIQCKRCRGTGERTIQSPLGTYKIRTTDTTDDPDVFASIPKPPFGYVQPSDTILKFSRDEINDAIEKAFMFININVSNTQIQGGETATKIIIDREEMFAFLLKLSNSLYGLLQNVINTAGRMRYDDSDIKFKAPDITKPQEFRIRNQEELTEEIARNIEAGSPDTIIKELLRELYEIRFNLIANRDDMINLIFFSDRALTKSELDINAGISIGTFAKWEKVLHDSIEIFIKDEMIAAEKFFEQTLEDQRTAIQKAAQLKAAEIAPAPTGTTQNILDEANNGATGTDQS